MFASWELLALSASPRQPGGELALIWRFRTQHDEAKRDSVPVVKLPSARESMPLAA